MNQLAMNYHNTTGSEGRELANYQAQAESQEDKILAWFKTKPNCGASPTQVNAIVLPEAPITSVRRAMSNLTRDGHLVKTSGQVKGPYDRPEYLWKYVPRGTSGNELE